MSLQSVAELPKAVGEENFVVFEVRYDSRDNTLTIDPDSAEICGENQIVVWNFRGLPNDCFPMVAFAKLGNAGSFTGPFANLVRWNWRIVGIGNSEIPLLEPYEGWVSVHAAQGKELASQSFKLKNARGNPIAQDKVVVTLRKCDDGNSHLHAEPEHITTCAGGPMTWDFSEPIRYLRERGLNYRPSIIFKSDQLETPALGPFRQLCFQDEAVIGIGLRGEKKRFCYEITLDPYPGEIHPIIRKLRPLDPVIDDEGNPPGGPGG